ncbi:MAG: NAD(P)/FAD-dependent oxidoreductase, partial [Mycobacterium sp.]|nr:NAD(P)/FAD-dependent oxidoreductase [Mycobacterium sp.]
FIDPALRLSTSNNLYPDRLYKGVVWTANPKLMYLGMQDQYYTFNIFDAQAFLARDIVLGRVAVPAREAMDADIAGWRARYAEVDGVMEQIDFQTEYVRDLMTMTDYPPFDIDLVQRHFVDWEHDKDVSITGYRDRSFASPCTGTVGPAPRTTWWDELDDSLARFLRG